VRQYALQGWALPADVKIEATGQVLSALRRVVAGEPVAVLLDQTQAAALPGLPFSSELKTLMQSPPLPVALIAVVNSRLSVVRSRALQAGLLKLAQVPSSADSLRALRLQGFVLPMLPPSPRPP
jgi:hypothetical protein